MKHTFQNISPATLRGSRGELFGEMTAPREDRERRQRAAAAAAVGVKNAAATTVFRYGSSAVTDDGRGRDGDVVVHYWSGRDKSARNASLRDVERRTNVTASQHHQQQQQQQHRGRLATSSFAESSVHSAVVVLTIAGRYTYVHNSFSVLLANAVVSCAIVACNFFVCNTMQ